MPPRHATTGGPTETGKLQMKIRTLYVTAAFALASTAVQSATLETMQVYKSPTCGCCEKYIQYLKQERIKVEVINVPDMAPIKTKYGVPPALQSCHTSLANGYVIEGHVPVAAMKKLVAEGRPIKGIALPGMPPGSPGMGPVKAGTLTVYEIPDSGQAAKVFSIE